MFLPWLQKLYTILFFVLPLRLQKNENQSSSFPHLNCLLHSRKQLQQTGGIGAVAKTLLSTWPQPEGNILGHYCRSPLRTLEAADWHFYTTGCYSLKLFTQVIIIPLLPYPHALLNTALAPQTPFPDMSIFCSPQRPNAIADAQLGLEEGAGLRLSLHSRFNQS